MSAGGGGKEQRHHHSDRKSRLLLSGAVESQETCGPALTVWPRPLRRSSLTSDNWQEEMKSETTKQKW